MLVIRKSTDATVQIHRRHCAVSLKAYAKTTNKIVTWKDRLLSRVESHKLQIHLTHPATMQSLLPTVSNFLIVSDNAKSHFQQHPGPPTIVRQRSNSIGRDRSSDRWDRDNISAVPIKFPSRKASVNALDINSLRQTRSTSAKSQEEDRNNFQWEQSSPPPKNRNRSISPTPQNERRQQQKQHLRQLLK